MWNNLQTILLVLALIFSIGAFANAWLTRVRLELLEKLLANRLDQKLNQMKAMHFTALSQQGMPSETLREAFPPIADLAD